MRALRREVGSATHEDVCSRWHIGEQDAAPVTMNVGAEHRDVFEQRGDFWAGVLEDRLDGVGREAIGEFLEDEMPALAGLVLDFDRKSPRCRCLLSSIRAPVIGQSGAHPGVVGAAAGS